MQPSDKIPSSRFPADVGTVLALPGAMIFFVVVSYLPRLWRTTLFSSIGVALMVLAIHLARSSRMRLLILAALYLLIAIAMFYIAYIEATLFA
jgi:uncharacterized membrane protein YqgA involved in biofilm formation